MDIKININDNFRVSAQIGSHVINTDQSVKDGGDDTAPTPFEIFCASLGMCAAHYINAFCRKRDIPSELVGISQTVTRNPDNKLDVTFDLNISFAENFPEKYKKAVLKAAEGCTIKKVIENKPVFRANVI
ncbi:MAG: OsmC family protein [Oligoflexia bacterium]|nr:OsmC family protein [Oligoflexia bacterium]